MSVFSSLLVRSVLFIFNLSKCQSFLDPPSLHSTRNFAPNQMCASVQGSVVTLFQHPLRKIWLTMVRSNHNLILYISVILNISVVTSLIFHSNIKQQAGTTFGERSYHRNNARLQHSFVRCTCDFYFLLFTNGCTSLGAMYLLVTGDKSHSFNMEKEKPLKCGGLRESVFLDT